MEDKYRIMTLKYLYQLLDLKKYEKILEDNNLESIIEDNDHFKYFTLLSEGDMSLFTEDEQNEMNELDNYDLEELLSNNELSNKFLEFIKRTYNKFYFSNIKGAYIYYGVLDDEHMAPDDAFALGINYRISYDEEEYDKKVIEVDDIITDIINEIQFTDAEKNNLKVAVIENNGLRTLNDSLMK